jgi:phosphohistidine phosphatase SixA
VAGTLRLKKKLLLCPHLACGGDPRQLIKQINKDHSGADSAMLVGHEPDLSELASLLLSGRADGVRLEFKKGGLCVLETDGLRAGQCATLLWLAPPKLLI